MPTSNQEVCGYITVWKIKHHKFVQWEHFKSFKSHIKKRHVSIHPSFFHPCSRPWWKPQLCFLMSVYDWGLVTAVRPGPAHTCHRWDGTDNAGTAFIIIDIPHSYPMTFIAAHAVTSDLLIHSSPIGGMLLVRGGGHTGSSFSNRREQQGGQRSPENTVRTKSHWFWHFPIWVCDPVYDESYSQTILAL